MQEDEKCEMVVLVTSLMNIVSDQDTMSKVLQAKNDILEKVQVTLTYGNGASNVPSPKGVKGTPTHIVYCSVEEDATPQVIECQLREKLRPKDLKMGILSIQKTTKGMALTTEEREDKERLEATIKEKSKIKGFNKRSRKTET